LKVQEKKKKIPIERLRDRKSQKFQEMARGKYIKL